MNTYKFLVATVAAAVLLGSGAAYAGPSVTVTFKHVGVSGSAQAAYSKVSANENSTYVNARPKPLTLINAGETNTYTVQSQISPDSNYASVRYKIGSRTCVFTTTFVNAIGPGGVKTPRWNKSQTASGGATCTATTTSVNYVTKEWAVEFTMK
ncbi:MAG: hypothetical protein ACRESJ_05835 [Pseudomonas sp.]|uniref:hypothetical protein n=1 Tax=Pseudomonas sp. TaxID=306 RepID=UPI003D6EC93F